VVGIVVVSHSDEIARGVVALAREMAPPELLIEAAGGTDEPGVLGTSAERVREAMARVISADGVLVLMDLGSALMSAELAVELLDQAPGPVRLSAAPLVEGTVAAAAAAGGGASLEHVAAEAARALTMKTAQVGDADALDSDRSASPPVRRAEVEAELEVANEVGLHARPAARFVETVGRYDAEVLVARADADKAPVSAASLTNLIALGARRGDRVRVLASGPQAREAVAALTELAASGFGDAIEPPAAGTVLAGIAVSAGIALGHALRLESAVVTHAARTPGSAKQELSLLEGGLATTRAELDDDRAHLQASAGDAEAAIFDAHLALLKDESLLDPARTAIAAGTPAETAFADAASALAGVYRWLDDPLLAERAADVLDVGRRVSAAIAAQVDAGADQPAVASGSAVTSGPDTATAGEESADASAGRILIADELVPSQASRLDPSRVAGLATARGSATAHAAIIARALGIPAVFGLGESVRAIADGTPLLVDGGAGTVVVAPADDAAGEAQAQNQRQLARANVAHEQAREQALLASGERIEVFANIGGLADARLAVEHGAEGVGLLRTEFLFLERSELPSEDEQAETLHEIAAALDGRPLIVRTLDAGADKPLPALPMPAEANPFLGVRGIRAGLRHPALLETQLRAVLRTAADHPLRLMLPMVASLAEIEATRALLEKARADTGIDAPLELGIMVEVPAAALQAAELVPQVDFFSIGSNDLTQYTMAAERGSAALGPLLAEPQPAVLRLIQATVEAAHAHGRWVGVCGEMAGDPACALLLAGLGVDELSMAPRLIPEVKRVLRTVELGRARTAVGAALRAASAEAARQYATELLGG
jgi:multiphosphoryl transfer protein